jgi:hypothetical protein
MKAQLNREGQTLELKFVDGWETERYFSPGDLSYDPDSGLVISLVLELKGEGRVEFALQPHSQFRSNVRKLADFFAPFGLGLYSGELIQTVKNGSDKRFASFGAFLATSVAIAAIHAYLQDLEKKDSGYYSLNKAHELAIGKPLYLPT